MFGGAVVTAELREGSLIMRTRKVWVFGMGMVLALGLGVAACGGGSTNGGGTSSATKSGSSTNSDNIKKALSAAITGCWSPDASGGNVWGAYRQDYFYEGFTLNSSGTTCIKPGSEGSFSAGDPAANLQTFHSSTDAAKGAKEESSVSHFLAAYQGGVYVLTVTQYATPQLAQAATHVAESNGMKKATR